MSAQAQRAGRSAATWFKRAVGMLGYEAQNGSRQSRWLAGYEAERLLSTVLFEVDPLVAALNDDAELDTLEKWADDLRVLIRRKRIAAMLANTEGRTPEEARAFAEKAAELGS